MGASGKAILDYCLLSFWGNLSLSVLVAFNYILMKRAEGYASISRSYQSSN
jgi:hypothetical protein